MESSTAGEFCSSDHSVVINRKQHSNNRKRPSPYCAAAEIISSYRSDGGSGSNCISTDHYSPSISKEDEEVAECLMLLAKGICPRDELQINRQRRCTETLRLSEMEANSVKTDARKVDGYSVHECKTCYRTFPSGQALGGHQTSHKKLKLVPAENTETSLVVLMPPLVNSEEGEDEQNILGSVPLQTIFGNGKANLHECAVCGEKFLSGQALGGHMGRHRITRPWLSKKPYAFFPSNTDSSADVETQTEVQIIGS